MRIMLLFVKDGSWSQPRQLQKIQEFICGSIKVARVVFVKQAHGGQLQMLHYSHSIVVPLNVSSKLCVAGRFKSV